MGITTITSKGQITLPAEIRDLPGYGPGDGVSVTRDLDGKTIVESFEEWLHRVRIPRSRMTIPDKQLTENEVDELVAQAIVEDYLDEGDPGTDYAAIANG